MQRRRNCTFYLNILISYTFKTYQKGMDTHTYSLGCSHVCFSGDFCPDSRLSKEGNRWKDWTLISTSSAAFLKNNRTEPPHNDLIWENMKKVNDVVIVINHHIGKYKPASRVNVCWRSWNACVYSSWRARTAPSQVLSKLRSGIPYGSFFEWRWSCFLMALIIDDWLLGCQKASLGKASPYASAKTGTPGRVTLTRDATKTNEVNAIWGSLV